MASFKKGDVIAPLTTVSSTARRFDPEALAQVLIEDFHLTPDSPLYVAYSGGMDSHVLLHALTRLREHAPWRVAALHIDHGLQPDSARWANHAAQTCAALDVPFEGERITVRDIALRGREDAARQARYAALARRLPAGAVLLTGHHQEDQAETVLLQLLRGGGVAGLAAMPAITGFAQARLARPLLGFARRALADYASAHELRWVEDTSNGDESLARNYVRHQVWPTLVARWPRAAGHFAAAARYQAEAAELIEQLGAMDLRTVATPEGEVQIALLLQLAPVRQANALRCWIRSHDLPLPGERALQQILANARQCPQTRHAEVRWGKAQVRRYRERLVASRVAASAPLDWEARWNPDTELELPGGEWRLCAHAGQGAGLSRARIGAGALRVRLRRGGERCRLRGHRHKLKKLLQDAGIPPWERARLPLVYVGDEIAAVGDRWICEPYAAQPDEDSLVLMLQRRQPP